MYSRTKESVELDQSAVLSERSRRPLPRDLADLIDSGCFSPHASSAPPADCGS